jgi:hypothetical protein
MLKLYIFCLLFFPESYLRANIDSSCKSQSIKDYIDSSMLDINKFYKELNVDFERHRQNFLAKNCTNNHKLDESVNNCQLLDFPFFNPLWDFDEKIIYLINLTEKQNRRDTWDSVFGKTENATMMAAQAALFMKIPFWITVGLASDSDHRKYNPNCEKSNMYLNSVEKFSSILEDQNFKNVLCYELQEMSIYAYRARRKINGVDHIKSQNRFQEFLNKKTKIVFDESIRTWGLPNQHECLPLRIFQSLAAPANSRFDKNWLKENQLNLVKDIFSRMTSDLGQ